MLVNKIFVGRKNELKEFYKVLEDPRDTSDESRIYLMGIAGLVPRQHALKIASPK